MANIIVKLQGQHSVAVVNSSLQTHGRKKLPDFLRHVGESIGPFEPLAVVQVLNGDAVAAHGIITILDYTKMTDGDTYKIGSKVLTAKSSGASTNQFNIGASNNASAANLGAAIVAYYGDVVGVSVASAVVTVTSRNAGIQGNAIGMAIIQGTGGSASCDAALASGAEDTAAAKSHKTY